MLQGIRSNDQPGNEINKQSQKSYQECRPPKTRARNPASEGKWITKRAGFSFVTCLLASGGVFVNVDVLEFRFGKMFALGGDIVEPKPKNQPKEADATSEDESHFPSLLVPKLNHAPRDE